MKYICTAIIIALISAPVFARDCRGGKCATKVLKPVGKVVKVINPFNCKNGKCSIRK